MQEIPCVICGSMAYTVLYPATIDADAAIEVDAMRCTSSYYDKHPQIVRCRRCRHVYTNPCWGQSELLAAYTDVEDETYVQEEEGRKLTFQRRLSEMERVTGPAVGRRLLDLGAYTGVFVQEALRAGWDAMGIELSQWCVDVARTRGLPVLQGNLDTAVRLGKTFDVITLWDVIEHMVDPPAEIHKAHQLLAKGGFLVVHTVNINSLFARLMGAKWPWLIGMHLNFFSKKSFCDLLQREGLRIVKAGSSGRYLRLGYFTSSIASLQPFPGRLLARCVHALHLDRVPLRLNFGDLMTVYAQKDLLSTMHCHGKRPRRHSHV